MSTSSVRLSRASFLSDVQGKAFARFADDPRLPLDEVLLFFSDPDRQRRMVESEIHHDRSPLAGVVRELEDAAAIERCLSETHSAVARRLRAAVRVVVRMVMEGYGWKKSGRTGMMGVRSSLGDDATPHNVRGLAFWFLRSERYVCKAGMPFRSVRDRNSDTQISSDSPAVSGGATGLDARARSGIVDHSPPE